MTHQDSANTTTPTEQPSPTPASVVETSTNITPLLSTTHLVEENGPNRHVVSINEVDPRLTLTLNDSAVSEAVSPIPAILFSSSPLLITRLSSLSPDFSFTPVLIPSLFSMFILSSCS